MRVVSNCPEGLSPEGVIVVGGNSQKVGVPWLVAPGVVVPQVVASG